MKMTTYKVTVGIRTLSVKNNIDDAIARAQELSTKHEGVAVVVTKQEVVWKNVIAKNFMQNILRVTE